MSEPNYSLFNLAPTIYKKYYAKYDVLEEQLKKEMQGKDYKLVDEMSANEVKTIVWLREKENEKDIFEMIHVKQFHNHLLEIFDERFTKIWNKCIGTKINVEINFTFVLCVDEETKEMKKFKNDCYIRYREKYMILPVFLVGDYYREYYSLDTNLNNIKKKDLPRYIQMQKEVLDVFGDYPEESYNYLRN